MKTAKIYIEVSVTERLPEIRHIKESGGLFHTVDKYGNKNVDLFDTYSQCFQPSIMCWLEPVEVPTDEEILNETSIKQDKHQTPFLRGVEWILQKLKINQK